MNFDDETYFHDTYVVVQERKILVQYTVEATSLSNAVKQIESGDYSGVICEDASHAETEQRGRIVSASVNDDD